jgi:hypothetical protein
MTSPLQCAPVYSVSIVAVNRRNLEILMAAAKADAASRYLAFGSGFVMTCDRPNSFSIDEPPQTLGLGNTIATGLRFRTRRFATVEAATRLAWFCSDLTGTAGPSLGPQRRRPRR